MSPNYASNRASSLPPPTTVVPGSMFPSEHLLCPESGVDYTDDIAPSIEVQAIMSHVLVLREHLAHNKTMKDVRDATRWFIRQGVRDHVRKWLSRARAVVHIIPNDDAGFKSRLVTLKSADVLYECWRDLGGTDDELSDE